MRKQDGRSQERELLVKGLKDKLEWYTMCASDEEYDERAVESILYLLDGLEPLEEGEPEPEEAWEGFQALVREREERHVPGAAEGMEAEVPGKTEATDTEEEPEKLVPVEMAGVLGKLEPVEVAEVLARLEAADMPEDMVSPALEDMSETAGKGRRAGKAKGRRIPKVVGRLENREETEISEELGISAKLAMGQKTVQTDSTSKSRILHGMSDNQKGAVVYNKYIVAAVLLLLVVSMVGIIGNVQAGASPDTGFFHWLKRDNTGIQMITSPENLDGETNVQDARIYSDGEDVPEWAQEWLKIDNEFEMPKNYVWDCYEVEEPRNFHKITSYYLNKDSKMEMLLGMIMYHGEISFNTEELADYKYVDSYVIEQKEMNILSKTDEMGINYYLIYFFEGNCQYFMQGQDNLKELKELVERYWLYVKNNLEENEIICNKLLSQAIYK